LPTVRFDREPPPGGAAEWYGDPSGRLTAGYWSHEGGTLEVRYTEHEFCVLLAGRVDAAGDGFVIPAGFEGTWETLEPVRKWYVIFEPKAG